MNHSLKNSPESPHQRILQKSVLTLIFFSIFLHSEATINLDSLVQRQRRILDTRVFSTVDKSVTAEELIKSVNDSVFVHISGRTFLSPRKIYWYKLDFKNIKITDSEECIIRFSAYDKITLYSQGEGTLHHEESGRMAGLRDKGLSNAVDFLISEENLIEGQYLLARIQHISRKKALISPSCLSPAEALEKSSSITKRELLNYIPYLLFIGGMLLMILYAFGIYFMNRDKLFNYYAIYLLSLVLYLGVRLPLIFGPLELRYPLMMHLYNELIQVLVNIFYLLFASFFMNTRHDFPQLHKAIRYAIMFLSGIMVLQFILILSVRYAWIETYLIQVERYFMIIFSMISYVYILLNYKKKIVLYLLVGSLFFLSGAILAMFLNQIHYMMLGAAIEVFIFSLGMGYRIKVVERDRQSIENEMNKLRLTALRAQMNPHFIFNSLNSIRAYVISNETRKASDYLNMFARLIRLILHYSSLNTITLEAELEALKLYVELEQMRYRTDFGYSVEIAPGLDQNKLLLPPLILQPYVENAIVHGLTSKQGAKHLQLIIGKNASRLMVTIRDNGVGRNYSKKIHMPSDPSHQSVAMELTSKRINLSDDTPSKGENITVTDLYDQGQPAGTEVKLQLPLQTNQPASHLTSDI